MKTATSLRMMFFLLVLLTAEKAFSVNFTRSATGLWSNSAQWSPVGVPGINDNATITGGVCTLTDDVLVKDLTLTSATLAGNFNVAVGGILNWRMSTIAGSGTVTVTGSTSMATPGTNVLDQKTLVMNGGASINNGAIDLNNNAILRNGPASTFTLTNNQNNEGMSILSGGTFENQGTIVRNNGTIVSMAVSATFVNTGIFNLNGGNVDLTGGGSHTGATVNIASGAYYGFTGGTHVLTNSSFLGQGYIWAKTALTIPAGNTVSSRFYQDFGTTTDAAGISPLSFYQVGGTYNRTVGSTMTTSGITINAAGGIFSGNFDVNVSGNMIWEPSNATSTISGTGVISVAGTTTLQSNGVGIEVILDQKTLNLNGGATHRAGNIDLNNGAILRNGPGSVFVISPQQNAESLEIKSGGTFENLGTITRNGTGVVSMKISAAFNNFGIFNLNTANLELSGGGSHVGATVNIASGYYYGFTGGTHVLATSSFLGQGFFWSKTALTIPAGNVVSSRFYQDFGTTTDDLGISPLSFTQVGGTYNRTSAATMTTSSVTINGTGGTLSGNFDMNVSGAFSWQPLSGTSTISGTGMILVTGATTLLNVFTLSQKTLVMNGGGTFLGIATLSNGAILRNGVGSTFTLSAQNAGVVINGTGTFENLGTFNKSNFLSFNLDAVLLNSGTFTLGGGATNSTFSNLPQPIGGTFSINSGATMTLTGAGGMVFQGPVFTNNGTVAGGQNLTFSGAAAQTLAGVGSISRLVLSPSNLAISGQQTVSSAFSGTTPNTTIDGGWLDLGTIATTGCESSACFLKTANGGSLRRTVGPSQSRVFALGTSTGYDPATLLLTAGSASTKFGASVAGMVSGNLLTHTFVNREWEIQKITATTANATATFQWNQAEEAPFFNRLTTSVGQLSGSVWSPLSAFSNSTTVSAGVFSRSATSVSTFSKFGVLAPPCNIVAAISPTNPAAVCSPATILLTASPNVLGNTFQWKKDGAAITGATNPTFSAASSGSYTVVVADSPTCFDESDAVAVTVNPQPTVSLPPFSNVCLTSPPFVLTGGLPTGGVYVVNGFPLLNGIFDPVEWGLGLKTLRYDYTDANGCANSAVSSITVDQPATVAAGADLVKSFPQNVPLAGSFGGSATSVFWTSSGSGVFSNASSPTSTYSFSVPDYQAGSAVLTLTTNDPAGACLAVSDALTIFFIECPISPQTRAVDCSYFAVGTEFDVETNGCGGCSSVNNYDNSSTLDGSEFFAGAAWHEWTTTLGASTASCVFEVIVNLNADNDGDLIGDPCDPDDDNDGAADAADCQPFNAAINPSAIEICDNIDNDCDGLIDDLDPNRVGGQTWFADQDGDGAGDASVSQMACVQPPNFVSNSNDLCPFDVQKVAQGICGCGVSDADSDGDGTPNCNDFCPNDPLKIAAGQCGCGVSDQDSDGDGTANCNDGCPNDPLKIAPGLCGCGVPENTCSQPPILSCPTNQNFGTEATTCTKTWIINDPISAAGTGAAFWSLAFSGNPLGNPAAQTGIADGSNSVPILFQKGSTTVTITATNAGPATVTCTFLVAVLDQTPPVALCKTIPIEVILTQNTTISPVLIDNGSWDNCLVASKTVSPTMVNCSNIGPKVITLKVIDAAGNQSQCTSTIQVSPPPSLISVADKTVVEGSSSGVTPIQFTVVRTNNLCSASVDFTTVAATALASEDFEMKAGTVDFFAGSFSKQVPVSIKKDAKVELNETFELVLSNPVNGTFGDDRAVCTITNDDATQIEIVNVGSQEGNIATKAIKFTATMDKKADVAVTFFVQPTDGTATLADQDYVNVAGTATIPAGQNSVQFSVFAKGDLKAEPNETVIVQLQNLQASGRAVTIQSTCVATISNDDGSAMAGKNEFGIQNSEFGADSRNAERGDSEIRNPKSEIDLFPNPTDGFLSVVLPEGDWNLTVFDLFGNLIFEKAEVEKGVFQIDVGSFSTGVYFLKAENLAQPDGSKTLRFV